MSKPLQWVLGICLVLLTLALVATMVVPLFLPSATAAGWGMMMNSGHMLGGRGMLESGRMMGGRFGGGMFLGPLLWIGLIVAGGVVLVRVFTRRPAAAAPSPAPAAPAATVCPHCAQPILVGWKACPACGEKL